MKTSTFVTIAIAVAASVAGLIAVASGCPESGQAATEFNLKPAGGGKSVALSDLKGKPTLVVFWATWCPPCRREIPELKEIYGKYGSKMNMLGVAVNYRQTEKDVANFSKESGLPYPVLWDVDNKAMETYCVGGIPTLILVDPQGVIRYRANQISPPLYDLLDQETGSKGKA